MTMLFAIDVKIHTQRARSCAMLCAGRSPESRAALYRQVNVQILGIKLIRKFTHDRGGGRQYLGTPANAKAVLTLRRPY